MNNTKLSGHVPEEDVDTVVRFLRLLANSIEIHKEDSDGALLLSNDAVVLFLEKNMHSFEVIIGSSETGFLELSLSPVYLED